LSGATLIGDVTGTVGANTIGAGKVTSSHILDGTIATADLAAGAVTASKVEGLTSGQIIVGVDGTAANNAKVTMNGDVTMSNAGVTAIGTGKVTSSQILDATIATADLAAGAVTASKVEGLTSGQIIVGVDGTAANNAKVTMNGDVTMSNSGVTAIGTGKVTSTQIFDGTIVNADVSASAAIADTKLATISTSGKVSNSATTATNLNTASAIVARDAAGDFSANTITAANLSTTSTGTATVFNTNATTLNVGGAATALNLGATTGTTTVNNSLSVNKNFNVSGSTGLGLTTISSSVSTSTPLSSVDSYSGVIITQTSTIGNYTLPTPTGTTPIGRIFKVVNASGSNSRINVGVGPYSIPVGKSAEFIWDGTAWSEPASTSSVSSLVSITANYTVGASDNTVVLRKTAIGSVMVTLPSSNIQNGQIYRFINMSSAYDINLSASFRSSNLETSSRIGVGASNIDGGVAGNKVTIQWDADTAEWLQVGN